MKRVLANILVSVVVLVFSVTAYGVSAEETQSSKAAADETVNCEKLKFFGEVEPKAVNEILDKVINCLDLEVATKLTITSPGGELDQVFAFYDSVMAHPQRKKLTTVATGGVSSAAVIMYMAGEQRLVTKHATILIHMVSYGLNGNYTIRDLEEVVEDAQLDQQFQAKIVAERSGMNEQEVMAAMYRGSSYNAKQSRELNLSTALIN